MIGYIYFILNKVNGKTYVGHHKSCKLWNEGSYMGSGKRLKLAFKKYGKGNFEKFLIQYCETKDELDRQEIFWIAEYRKRGKAEYNVADGGYCTRGMQGHHHSIESRELISKNNRHYQTEETKEKISKNNAHFWLGKKKSDETRKHMSESHKGKPGNNKGRHFSEEHKRKLSESKKGKTRPEYVKDNLKLYHWYTNDITTVWAKECPEGFTLGRKIK